jgi:flagellin-like hook-associated protein FlgL
MAKDQVLEQAGVSVLAQANQLPQLALKLLS